MSNWFFLSYARHDRNTDAHNCISKFYEDVDREIRGFKVIKQGQAGFFDGTGIEPGESWPTTLGEALRTCRVLICMYSPAYFNSEYCGKEWEVFDSRLRRDFAGVARPPLIMPVLFSPPEDVKARPSVAQDIQYAHDDYPKLYLENGLKYLMVRDSLNEDYLNFLQIFLRKFKSAIARYELSPLASLPDIKTVPDAFHPQDEPPGESAGPLFAEFVYVAARRDEIGQLKPPKPNEEYYGPVELAWTPHLPPEAKEIKRVFNFAQRAADAEGFVIFRQGPIGKNLIQQIQEAQNNNRIVLLIVDTWTLRLPEYCSIMQQYDSINFRNCAVLIAWNMDSKANRPTLETSIRQALFIKSGIRDERYFVETDSPEKLERELSVMLQKVRMQILEYSQVFHRAESERTINKPELQLSGGI